MQGMAPVPSSIAKQRNLKGLWSRRVMVPRVSAHVMRRELRVKEWFGEIGGVRVRRSKANSFTCVLCCEIGIGFLFCCILDFGFAPFSPPKKKNYKTAP